MKILVALLTCFILMVSPSISEEWAPPTENIEVEHYLWQCDGANGLIIRFQHVNNRCFMTRLRGQLAFEYDLIQVVVRHTDGHIEGCCPIHGGRWETFTASSTPYAGPDWQWFVMHHDQKPIDAIVELWLRSDDCGAVVPDLKQAWYEARLRFDVSGDELSAIEEAEHWRNVASGKVNVDGSLVRTLP